MNHRLTNALLLCSTLGLSHVVLLVGWSTPFAYSSVYRLKSLQEARALMPDITEVAVDHSWVFAVAMGLIGFVTAIFIRRIPERKVPFAIIGLCGQWLLAWVAILAFLFKAVAGNMSLHHGPEFDITEFMRFGAGVFPVTLTAVLVPLFMAVKAAFRES
jgi:hypothetical protein